MNRLRIGIAALVAAFALPLFAQVPFPPGKWWTRPEVVRQLELTRDQQQRLDAIFTTAAPELIDRKAEVEKATIELRSVLDREQLDRDAVRAVVGRLNGARSRLFEREVMMMVEMRQVLAPEQWHRLRSFIESRRQDRPGTMRDRRRPPGGGPGGPAGPGRP